MQYQGSSNGRRLFGQVEYVVANAEDNSKRSRYDYADNPCQTGSEQECAEWLNEQLTACYND
jgi:alkyl sulfatase BDS1-like metallo-beta-lactamase superfamily hydrolase